MIVRLKTKLLAGFMLLASLLVVAGSISVLEFIKLSSSFSSLLSNNYKSIEASKQMLEALEREDSGILLLLLGEWEKGRSIIQDADASFQISFEIAKNNITEDNEQQLISAIDEQYNSYKLKWIKPIVDTQKQGDISWYHNSLHKEFLALKAVHQPVDEHQSKQFIQRNFYTPSKRTKSSNARHNSNFGRRSFFGNAEFLYQKAIC